MLGTAVRALPTRFGQPPELSLWVRSALLGTEHFHWHTGDIEANPVRPSQPK
jgi:hypothetical protein